MHSPGRETRIFSLQRSEEERPKAARTMSPQKPRRPHVRPQRDLERVQGLSPRKTTSPDRPASSQRRRIPIEGNGGIFDKLTDPALFTGHHKHRFDDDGRGKGLAGRDAVAKGSAHGGGGSTHAYQGGTVHDISQIMRPDFYASGRSKSRPRNRAERTVPETTGVFSKLTDERHYTGTHKHSSKEEPETITDDEQPTPQRPADAAEVQRQQQETDRLAAPRPAQAAQCETAEESDSATAYVAPRIDPSEYVQHRASQAKRLEEKSAVGAERLRAHKERKAHAVQTQAAAQAFGSHLPRAGNHTTWAKAPPGLSLAPTARPISELAAAEHELEAMRVPSTKAERDALFSRWDKNGNVSSQAICRCL